VTDSDGRFRIGSLDPGQYTAIAVGPGGMAVVAFELISAEATASHTRPPSAAGDVARFVVQGGEGGTPYPGDSLNVQVAPLPQGEPLGIGEEVAATDAALTDGFVTPGGGGFGGGGFGGGGGGGGFAGGGSLAGLAGIGAAVAVAVSDDEDDEIVPPPPASPVIP
jgi:hypothetical protein